MALQTVSRTAEAPMTLQTTCRCGMWPIEEYGPTCPSCNCDAETEGSAGDSRPALMRQAEEVPELRLGDERTAQRLPTDLVPSRGPTPHASRQTGAVQNGSLPNQNPRHEAAR